MSDVQHPFSRLNKQVMLLKCHLTYDDKWMLNGHLVGGRFYWSVHLYNCGCRYDGIRLSTNDITLSETSFSWKYENSMIFHLDISLYLHQVGTVGASMKKILVLTS